MSSIGNLTKFILAGLLTHQSVGVSIAQTPPSESEILTYDGLFKAAHEGDTEEIIRLVRSGADHNARDRYGRTPLHVATYASHEKAMEILAAAGAELNAFENQAYDIVTIAAVANDLDALSTALDLGASPGNVTSPYEGTALIAAAHLGHHQVVKLLIDAGAPLDHINNLHWTALMESVILGDGGSNHVKTAGYLVEAGADKTIPDRNGLTPFQQAERHGYEELMKLLKP